ncbi:hypothetical protein DFH08DRAFT_827082 [Mycena albidolilacea]|uniref:Uncharacterized protein n=1 Tax=Mycena albidolilacea TaxID=1033008 RepID=A0AAD6YYG6_9AGAR|nr:hypothetical protein DFH08DRAFT_827298 [Mycena albidolilacea]KAJ7301978.1 hypothetical protein DFH08DRAFT_827082 [Mycena albidolilacea]
MPFTKGGVNDVSLHVVNSHNAGRKGSVRIMICELVTIVQVNGGQSAKAMFPTTGTHRQEAVFTIVGALNAKDLPPVKGMKQHATLSGWNAPYFKKALENMQVEPWRPETADEGEAVISSNCRYFTVGRNIPEHSRTTFHHRTDPLGVLAKYVSDHVAHCVDNDVIYTEKDPSTFETGDLVEMGFAFVAWKKPGKIVGPEWCCMLVLRTLVFLDGRFTKEAHFAREAHNAEHARRGAALTVEYAMNHLPKRHIVSGAQSDEEEGSASKRMHMLSIGENTPYILEPVAAHELTIDVRSIPVCCTRPRKSKDHFTSLYSPFIAYTTETLTCWLRNKTAITRTSIYLWTSTIILPMPTAPRPPCSYSYAELVALPFSPYKLEGPGFLYFPLRGTATSDIDAFLDGAPLTQAQFDALDQSRAYREIRKVFRRVPRMQLQWTARPHRLLLGALLCPRETAHRYETPIHGRVPNRITARAIDPPQVEVEARFARSCAMYRMQEEPPRVLLAHRRGGFEGV